MARRTTLRAAAGEAFCGVLPDLMTCRTVISSSIHSPRIPEPTAKERARLKRPPEGGLVCSVTWKAIGDYQPDGSPTTALELYAGIYQQSVGMDRLWVRKDESQALARGEFPSSLKRRILPHVSYAVAGNRLPRPSRSGASWWRKLFEVDHPRS